MAVRAKYTEQIVVLATNVMKARIMRLGDRLGESESEVIRFGLDDGGLEGLEKAAGLPQITPDEVSEYMGRLRKSRRSK